MFIEAAIEHPNEISGFVTHFRYVSGPHEIGSDSNTDVLSYGPFKNQSELDMHGGKME